MPNYLFRYAKANGDAIRSTAMHCESDADAIRKAHGLMHDKFDLLEIFEGERSIYHGHCAPLQTNG